MFIRQNKTFEDVILGPGNVSLSINLQIIFMINGLIVENARHRAKVTSSKCFFFQPTIIYHHKWHKRKAANLYI